MTQPLRFGMPPPRRRADASLLAPQLQNAPPNTLAALHSFSELMMSEVLGRVTTLDSKAQNIIGWTSASLALLVATSPANWPVDYTRWQLGLIVIGLLSGLGAIAGGAVALWLIDVHWPSQQDWFREDLFGSPDALRTYHLLSLLETHEVLSDAAAAKAQAVKIAQWALVTAAACAGLVLLVSLVVGWFR